MELEPGEITVDGRVRTYTVRPAQRRGAPLVLALHGNMQEFPDRPRVSGPFTDQWIRFGEYADQWGVAVVYPDGVDGCWADGRGVTPSDEAGIDDLAYLRAVIQRCADQFGTEPEHTIVAGMSNGAFMAHRLAHESSDLIPVFAAVAGGLPTGLIEAAPTHAVSAILVHGTADTTVPIVGGYSRRLGPNGELRGRTMGLVESAEHWRAIDRCAGAGTTVTTDGTSRHTVDGGVGGSRVSAWTVFDGGHTWPGKPTPPEWADGPNTHTSTEFHASEEILRFAQPHLVPAATRKL